EVRLLCRPVVGIATMVEDPVAGLVRAQITTQFGEDQLEQRLLQLAEVPRLFLPLADLVGELTPTVLVIEAEPSRLLADPLHEELNAVARSQNLVNRLSDAAEDTLIIVGVGSEQLRHEFEGKRLQVFTHAGPVLTVGGAIDVAQLIDQLTPLLL